MNNDTPNLSPERQAKLEILRALPSAEYALLQVKSSVPPTVASLSATMLVVATFQDRILPLTNDVRWALIVLLILVPISLLISYCEIDNGFRAISLERKKALGYNVVEKKTSPFLEKTLTYAPFVEILILSWVITYITVKIILGA